MPMAGVSPSENLDAIQYDAQNSGDKEVLAKLRSEGKLNARERIISLLDSDSFVEIDAFVNHRSYDYNLHLHKSLGDGIVAGHGMLNDRRVVCFSQDKSIFSGSIGEMHAKKIVKILEFAEKSLLPVIAIWDGIGQRPEEGIKSLGPSGEILNILSACSGRVPLISIVLGNLSGVGALAVGLSDFTIMGTSSGKISLSNPDYNRHESEEEINFMEDMATYDARSGIACLLAEDENNALDMASKIISYIPDNMSSNPIIEKNDDPWNRKCHSLDKIINNDQKSPYDVKSVISQVTDKDSFLELFPNYARNLVIGFARLDGYSIGIVANQPNSLSGFLDAKSSIKAARFISFCDCFNLPIISFVDSPGFIPGAIQEWEGIIRDSAKLLFAYSEATVPKLSVIMKKAYGEAYLAMGCKQLGSDYNVSWPSGDIALMDSKWITNTRYDEEISGSGDYEERYGQILNYEMMNFDNPLSAAKKGWLEDIIDPSLTREYLVRALRPLLSKREFTLPKKHSNIPL